MCFDHLRIGGSYRGGKISPGQFCIISHPQSLKKTLKIIVFYKNTGIFDGWVVASWRRGGLGGTRGVVIIFALLGIA